MMPSNHHLTTEQLYELLDQPGLAADQAPAAHLRTCATCQLEFSDLRSALDNFRIAATNLAAAEMPPLMARRAEPPPAPRFAFRPQVFAASLATAAVLLTASLTLFHPRHGAPAVSNAPALASTQETDAELLNGIQQDLSASVPPSLAPLELTQAPR